MKKIGVMVLGIALGILTAIIFFSLIPIPTKSSNTGSSGCGISDQKIIEKQEFSF